MLSTFNLLNLYFDFFFLVSGSYYPLPFSKNLAEISYVFNMTHESSRNTADKDFQFTPANTNLGKQKSFHWDADQNFTD